MNLSKEENGKIVSQWTIYNCNSLQEMAKAAIKQCNFPKGISTEIKNYGNTAIYTVSDDIKNTKIYICM